MTSFVELEQTCDWNVNLSCWWSSSELSNTELHRKHIFWNGPGSIFTDFMTTAFSSWNSKACHGQFVGNPRCWSSWDWSATMPWGSISPSPSSRWKQSLKKITLKKLPPDEREQDDPTLASAQLFPNILEHRGPGSRLVRFLLWLHRLPGSVFSYKLSWHFSQVPGGRMAEIYGTKKVLGYRFVT